MSAKQKNQPVQALNTQQLSYCCHPCLAGKPNLNGQEGIAPDPSSMPWPGRLQDRPRDGTGSATSIPCMPCPGVGKDSPSSGGRLSCGHRRVSHQWHLWISFLSFEEHSGTPSLWSKAPACHSHPVTLSSSKGRLLACLG